MDPERRILFWNRSAERILGHKAEEVVGRQCYEALFGLPEQPSVPTCTRECLTVSLAQTRRLAPVARVRMRCASGGWKRVEVMTLTVPESESSVLVHCFYEQAGGVRTGRNEHPTRIGVAPRTPEALSGSASRGRGESLTSRELEVVALLAAREPIASIGGRLHLSSHTVLNHVRNAREKLGARTRLDLVLEAQRRGLV